MDGDDGAGRPALGPGQRTGRLPEKLVEDGVDVRKTKRGPRTGKSFVVGVTDPAVNPSNPLAKPRRSRYTGGEREVVPPLTVRGK